MHSVDWDGPGPSAPRLPIQVFTLRKGASAFVRLLASPEGVWLHWRKEIGPKGRSVPHLREACPWCPDPYLKWYAYGPALLWRTNQDTGKPEWVAVVAELTHDAFHQLGQDAHVPGVVVELTRPGARGNSRLQARVVERPGEAGARCKQPPPPPFDVRPILERLWGLSQRYTAGPTPAADGKTLVSGSMDKTLKLWDVEAGKLLRTLEGNKGPVAALAFSPDGRLFATAGGVGEEGKSVEVLLWDTKTGEPKRAFPDQTMQVNSLAFSPDGATLALGRGDGVTLGPDIGRLKTPGEFKLWKLK